MCNILPSTSGGRHCTFHMTRLKRCGVLGHQPTHANPVHIWGASSCLFAEAQRPLVESIGGQGPQSKGPPKHACDPCGGSRSQAWAPFWGGLCMQRPPQSKLLAPKGPKGCTPRFTNPSHLRGSQLALHESSPSGITTSPPRLPRRGSRGSHMLEHQQLGARSAHRGCPKGSGAKCKFWGALAHERPPKAGLSPKGSSLCSPCALGHNLLPPCCARGQNGRGPAPPKRCEGPPCAARWGAFNLPAPAWRGRGD